MNRPHIAASRVGILLASGFGLAAALLLPEPWVGPAALGAAVLVLGTMFGVRRAIHAGAAALVATGLLVAVLVPDFPIGVVLLAAIATVVAWDTGRFSVRLHAAVDDELETDRIELLHVVASGSVGLVGVGIGYALFLFLTVGGTAIGYALVVVGVLILLWRLPAVSGWGHEATVKY